jgi:hypothetical protein
VDELQLQVFVPSLLPPATFGPQPLVQGWAVVVQLVTLSCSPAGQVVVVPPLLLPLLLPEPEPLLEPNPPDEPTPLEPLRTEPPLEEVVAPPGGPELLAVSKGLGMNGPPPEPEAASLSVPLADESW